MSLWTDTILACAATAMPLTSAVVYLYDHRKDRQDTEDTGETSA